MAFRFAVLAFLGMAAGDFIAQYKSLGCFETAIESVGSRPLLVSHCERQLSNREWVQND